MSKNRFKQNSYICRPAARSLAWPFRSLYWFSECCKIAKLPNTFSWPIDEILWSLLWWSDNTWMLDNRAKWKSERETAKSNIDVLKDWGESECCIVCLWKTHGTSFDTHILNLQCSMLKMCANTHTRFENDIFFNQKTRNHDRFSYTIL